MKKVEKKYSSIRFKLFITLAVSVIIIILFLIILNNIVLESFYLYTKQGALIDIFEEVNEAYNDGKPEKMITNLLASYAAKNTYDIILETQDGINLYTSNENFIQTMNEMNLLKDSNKNIIYANKDINIKKVRDPSDNSSYILLSGELDNYYKLYIRMPISSIQCRNNNYIYFKAIYRAN